MIQISRQKMESAEAQLREIRLALKYCELDYKLILEDYREHLKSLEQKSGNKIKQDQVSKQINRRSA